MKRDHVLFLVIGLLAGFLAGYVMQEELSARQPQRAVHGASALREPSAGSPADPRGLPTTTAPTAPVAPMAEIEKLRRRIEADPKDAEAILELANLNFDIQNWPRALELYSRLLELRPGDPDALTDLGICLRAQKDFTGALARFREAQSFAPRHWQSRFNEVVVLAIDLNDLATATSRLVELEKLAPGNSDVSRLAEEVRRRAAA